MLFIIIKNVLPTLHLPTQSRDKLSKEGKSFFQYNFFSFITLLFQLAVMHLLTLMTSLFALGGGWVGLFCYFFFCTLLFSIPAFIALSMYISDI